MNDVNASIPVILSGRRPISLSLHVAGGIVLGIIIFTCCCTLLVRHKCAKLVDKLTGRRKKEKYFATGIEDGRKKETATRGLLRKKRKKRKAFEEEERDLMRERNEMIGTEITEAVPIIPPRALEKLDTAPSPIPCYKCYRKKERRRRAKRYENTKGKSR